MGFLTDFGDLGVLLPLAAAILFWLLATRNHRAALSWLLALGLCAGGIASLKIYFVACGSGMPASLQSPSGHTGLAALVYGALTALLARQTGGWRLGAVVVAVATLIAGIAMSRIMLGAHTGSETLAGLGVGLVALGVFLRTTERALAAAPSLRALGAVAVLILVLLHGRELHAEALLHSVGLYLKTSSFCG